jgi:hypothetical protein
LTYPDGCALEFREDFGWPLSSLDMRDGWFEGLPYPLQDMRPQGFLGRHFARRHAALLQVPENPALWSDDDALHALSLLGADTPGNLILGEVACRAWLEQAQRWRAGQVQRAWKQDAWENLYPRLAQEALLEGEPGSSAGGEFPKFTAVRLPEEGGGGHKEVDGQHVLVKFSGADGSAGSQRWADLLVCEHLAGQVLQEHLGIRAAASRIRTAGGRTFLEVERFDRHRLTGRSGVVSWASLDGAFFGTAGRPWPEAGRRLAAQGWLSRDQADQLARLWYFGQLIANTDMHDGNLAFQPSPAAAKPSPMLEMAPAYDMLPMAYAPASGVELPARAYVPRLPLPNDQTEWDAAARAARLFWERAAEDRRISAGFRGACGDNALTLRKYIA